MSHVTAPAKPTHITLDTLPQLFAHHRAVFGGWSMEDDTPPDGITAEEWTALGDTGRAVVVREREAKQTAERALAASRARPAPPKKTAAAAAPNDPAAPSEPSGGLDAEVLSKALQTAMKPFNDFMVQQQQREEQREAQDAAGKVVDAVMKAAKGQFKPDENGAPLEFHNPANALSMIDLTQVVDDNGAPDEAKIKTELLGLLNREKHLSKVVDTRRTAAITPGGASAGARGSDAPIGDRVKDVLAEMQQSVGIRPTTT